LYYVYFLPQVLLAVLTAKRCSLLHRHCIKPMASLTEEKFHSDMVECGQPHLLILSMADESDEWLNASELETVLDMLAVMETAEELKILECLTPLQKRQVWDATPYDLRVKLHHLKKAPTADHPPPRAIAPTPTNPVQPALGNAGRLMEVEPTTLDRQDSDASDTQLDDIAVDYIDPDEVSAEYQNVTASGVQERSPDMHTLAPGDRVVLQAKPGLSKAELMAIFEVVDIQSDWIHCKADPVGGRRYPADWLVLYSRSPNER
jgi:hypothetical protein